MDDLAAYASLSPENEPDPNDAELAADVRTSESAYQKLVRWADEELTDNISPELTDEQRSALGMLVIEEFAIDEASRDEWLREAKTARDLALQRQQPKSTPWPNASNVILPIMTTGADQFAARAYPAIVAERGIVKGVTSGSDEGIPLLDETGQRAIDPNTQPARLEGGPGREAAPRRPHRRTHELAAHGRARRVGRRNRQDDAHSTHRGMCLPQELLRP